MGWGAEAGWKLKRGWGVQLVVVGVGGRRWVGGSRPQNGQLFLFPARSTVLKLMLSPLSCVRFASWVSTERKSGRAALRQVLKAPLCMTRDKPQIQSTLGSSIKQISTGTAPGCILMTAFKNMALGRHMVNASANSNASHMQQSVFSLYLHVCLEHTITGRWLLPQSLTQEMEVWVFFRALQSVNQNMVKTEKAPHISFVQQTFQHLIFLTSPDVKHIHGFFSHVKNHASTFKFLECIV